jgi:succinoglycan biosynthesis transport protein ExoP
VVALCLGLGLTLGLTVALTSTPLYTATASLIIDPPAAVAGDGPVAAGDRGLDAGAIDSQVEVLRSDRIAVAVAQKLRLKDDPRFMDAPPSPLDALRDLLPKEDAVELDPEEAERLQLADIVTDLQAHAWIYRVGESYVLGVDYTSRFPDLSAQIANAYVDAYLEDQVTARIQSAKYASDWLAAQLVELRRRAYEADLAAQNFRARVPSAESGAPGQEASARVVQLRQLEREADTYRNLYQVALGRHQESLQQQSFPAASGRVISPATPPLRPSLPRKSLVVVLAVLAGAGAGIGIGALREMRDRGFRTGDQLRRTLGLPYLGLLPRSAKVPKRMGPARPGGHALVERPLMRQVVDAPNSAFSDTLRAVMGAIDARIEGPRPRAVGVISTLPGEGKTTIAANLALLAAISGKRTLLVDGDLHSAGLSEEIAPDAEVGLPQALQDADRFDRACRRDPETGLVILPTQREKTPQALSAALMRTLLERAQGRYDQVFVDLPPACLFGDAQNASAGFDGFLLVVRWGATPRGLVGALLAEEPELRDKTIGVVLSQVEMNRIRRYVDRESTDFYRQIRYG